MKINLTDDGVGLRLDGPPYDTEGLTMTILGNKGSGKSNLLAVCAEELHRNEIPFVFFDPNGDAVSLAELGDDVITIGNPNHIEPARRADYPLNMVLKDAGDFVRMNLHEGYSLVIDLTEPDSDDFGALDVFTRMVNEHYRQSGQTRTPCGVIVDEAHMFAPQSGLDEKERESRKALRRVAADGRKRGELLITATQRVTYLDKGIVFGANVRIFGKITYLPDYKAIQEYIPYTFTQIRQLYSGEMVVVTNGNYGKVKIKKRETTDLGRTPAFRSRARVGRPSKMGQLRLPLVNGGGSLVALPAKEAK
jgi:DNA helicase HerA-like ATPase